VFVLMLLLSTCPQANPGSDDGATLSVRIVSLGDSTTATARDWAPEIRQVYSDCLPGSLGALGIHAEVINAGVGDTTTQDALHRLDHDVRSRHPNVVIVQFGINDSWIDADEGRSRPRLTRTEYRDNLRAIVRILQRDGARVVLMTSNPMRWRDPYYIRVFEQHPGLLDTHKVRGIDRLLDIYAQDTRDVAHADGAALVDVHKTFEEFGRMPGHAVTDLLLDDGIHPNQAGQNLICSLLTNEVAKLAAPPSEARVIRRVRPAGAPGSGWPQSAQPARVPPRPTPYPSSPEPFLR
jgi:lysophospholipase L1-like esterase